MICLIIFCLFFSILKKFYLPFPPTLKPKTPDKNTVQVDVWSDILETGKVKAVKLEVNASATIADLTRSFRERFEIPLERRIVISQVGLMNGDQQKLEALAKIKQVLKGNAVKKHVLVAKIKEDKASKGFKKGSQKELSERNGRFERGGFESGGFERGGFEKAGFERGGFKKGGFERGGLERNKKVLREKTVSDNSWASSKHYTHNLKNESFQFASMGRNGKLNLPKLKGSTASVNDVGTDINCEENSQQTSIESPTESPSIDDSDSSSRTSDNLIERSSNFLFALQKVSFHFKKCIFTPKIVPIIDNTSLQLR